MDRKEQGRNPSSPNDKNRIVRITRGAERKLMQVELSDGSSFFLNKEIIITEGLECNLQINEDQIRNLVFKSQKLEAEKTALTLLSGREHSGQQIRQKLIKRKFPENIISAVLEDFISSGWVNDYRFSEQWIISRLKKHPEGKPALFSGLLKRGVNHSCAETVIAETVTDEIIMDALIRIAEKLKRKTDVSTEKLKKTLLSREFPISFVNQYLETEKNTS